MKLPQLRVRTEYSYRTCYGPVPTVAARLQEIECPAAGIVDTSGTWGHVVWAECLRKAEVRPMFGAEFVIPGEQFKPRAWALAADLAEFYRFSSSEPSTPEAWAEAPSGVVRFAGAALTDPETFDYIDVNPRSRRRAAAALALAKRTGKPLVITGDNDYPGPADARRFLAWDDSRKMTPQHIMTGEELVYYFAAFLPKMTLRKAVRSTHEVAERIGGLSLPVAPIICVDGDLAALVEEGKRYRLGRGHIKDWTPEYDARLKRELDLIRDKDFESYFLVVADMIIWAKERMLVGPARGSSAGSLACYLLQITEVDPLPHGLIFERFIDVNRNDLPDIDIDFNDQKREQVFAYLRERYGEANVARIGSVNRLKPRSVMAHVGKKLGIPHGSTFGVSNVLIEYSSGDARYGNGLEDTLQNTQPGQDLLKRFPEATLMGELENHASHSGVHAAGIIVSTRPVTEYCTVRDGVAHIDKKDAEALNLLKIDALGLRTLGVIEDTGCITPQELYDLPLNDPEVFAIFNAHKYSCIFQFEGAAQRRVAREIPVTDFRQIDQVTALARPGPLGGGAATAFTNRTAGREQISYLHPTMADYLDETQGVVLYQEQVMRIVRELGRFSWEDTSTIRKAMSGRKGQEYFDSYGERFADGAAESGLSREDAKAIWNQICAFGAWGMNRAHTVSYAVISYWCAYMKRYHPLEYAAASLRHAKDDEQVMEILRDLTAEGVPYTPFDVELSGVNWTAADGRLIGGFQNLIGIGPVKAAGYVHKRDSGAGLTDADRERISKCPPKHLDLRPAHTMWGHLYDEPDLHNVHGPIKEFGALQDRENAVVICRLIRLERRDENEAVRAAKRGGKQFEGPSLFLDAFVVDDSISKTVLMRINIRHWNLYGRKMADRAIPGRDWFLIRGRWLGQFMMMSVERIKCLTNPELFD